MSTTARPNPFNTGNIGERSADLVFGPAKKTKMYVVGFLFDKKLERVLLIRKNKPQWQKGLLNGVGGKAEEGETYSQAMTRKFKEEAGLWIHTWLSFHMLKFDAGAVIFYWATGDVDSAKSLTDEKLEIHLISELNSLPVIPNLRWLIPMCMDNQYEYGTSEILV